MRAALVQMSSGPDKNSNIKKAISFIEAAVDQGARFILLPEVYNYRGPNDVASLADVAEEIPGASTLPFLQIAKENNIHVLIGSIYERINNSDKAFNTSVFINNLGQIKTLYRKIHLFDVNIENSTITESSRFEAGSTTATAELDGHQIGFSICYDLRFPELYRKYAQKGVEIICVPSSFTAATGKAHWEILLRARAIENCCYVLAPNQVGIDGDGVESYGNSLAINPWGKIIGQGHSSTEEIIICELDFDLLKNVRNDFPALKHIALIDN